MGVPQAVSTASRRASSRRFPVRFSGGSYEIVEGLEVGEFAQAKIDATVNELKEERDAVKALGLV